ncbi:MAG: hypothetical protein AAFX78_03240 [Cyanobacteria bacterium J06638_20]
MARSITLRQGETAQIYQRRFSSLVTDIRFQAIARNSEPPAGEVTIQGSTWIFPKPPVTQPLQEHNVFRAGYWDTFFSISVTAHTDLEITAPGKMVDLTRWIVWAIVFVVIVALVILWLASVP